MVKLAPLVTGISPKEGPPGTRVTLRGENLGNDSRDLTGLTLFIILSLEFQDFSLMKNSCLYYHKIWTFEMRKQVFALYTVTAELLSLNRCCIKDFSDLIIEKYLLQRSDDMWCGLPVVCSVEISKTNHSKNRSDQKTWFWKLQQKLICMYSISIYSLTVLICFSHNLWPLILLKVK